MSKFRSETNQGKIHASLTSRPRFIMPINKIGQFLNQPGDPNGIANGQTARINDPTPKVLSTRKAAVLIPLCTHRGIPSVLYIKRSTRMTNHKGQIAFPGGIVDPEDKNDPIRCALRETHEEIGLLSDAIDIIGLHHDAATMDSKANTGKSTAITPVVGMIKHDISELSLNIDHNEVDYAFTVPLTLLLDKDRWGTTLQRPNILHQQDLLNVFPFSKQFNETFTYNDQPLIFYVPPHATPQQRVEHGSHVNRDISANDGGEADINPSDTQHHRNSQAQTGSNTLGISGVHHLFTLQQRRPSDIISDSSHGNPSDDHPTVKVCSSDPNVVHCDAEHSSIHASAAVQSQWQSESPLHHLGNSATAREIDELDMLIPGIAESYRELVTSKPESRTSISGSNHPLVAEESAFSQYTAGDSMATADGSIPRNTMLPIPPPYLSWVPHRDIQLPSAHINISCHENIWGATAHMTDLFVRQVIQPILHDLELDSYRH